MSTMSTPTVRGEELITPQELSQMLRVDPKTCTRWAKAGRVHTVRTMGGHRRFYLREIEALVRGETWEPAGGWPTGSLEQGILNEAA